MSFDVHNVAVGIGALSNATRPLFPAPSDANGGGITVLDWAACQAGSTNSSLILVKGTLSGGTFTANGTVSAAALGGTADPFAANLVKSGSVGSTAFVDADEWLAVAEGNVAAANAVAIVSISYVMGR